jgi:hypothetical protein
MNRYWNVDAGYRAIRHDTGIRIIALQIFRPNVIFFLKLKSIQGGKLSNCDNVKIDWGLEQVSIQFVQLRITILLHY